MAIYGVGAAYGRNVDVAPSFIAKGIACVGWDEKKSPSLHGMLAHIKTGDLIYIKSHPPQVGLIIKAVGVVISSGPKRFKKLGKGIRVRWTWRGDRRMGKIMDKYAVRNLTLYEEFNPKIQSTVIDLLLQAPQPSASNRAHRRRV